MSLLDICSNNSYWRGLEYYEDKNVKEIKKINDYEYDALVKGSKIYNVHLNIDHPKKSTCSCPHANGKSIICKHKVAVYFSIFKEAAQNAINERNSYYEDLEEREKEYDQKVKEETKRQEKYVNSLSEEQVRRMLVNYLVDEAMKYEENPYDEEEWY